MPFYACRFHGSDFCATNAEGATIKGFLTTRKTHANDERHAKQRLEGHLWNEEKVRILLEESQQQGAHPKIVIEEIWRISLWRYLRRNYAKGFVFYAAEGSAEDDEG